MLHHGRFIRPFPASEASPVIAQLGRQYEALLGLVDRATARRAEIDKDVNFTPTGRRTQLREFALHDGVGAIRAAREALQRADAEVWGIRRVLAADPVDKADFAGAVLRAQIRDRFREMDDQRRSDLVRSGSLDDQTKVALAEAPAWISGLSDQQHVRLREEAIFSANPEALERIKAIEAAAEAVADAHRATLMTFREIGGLGGEVNREAGEPILSDRFKAMLKGELDIEDVAPSPALEPEADEEQEEAA